MELVLEPSDFEQIRAAVRGRLSWEFVPTDAQIRRALALDRGVVARAYEHGWEAAESNRDLSDVLEMVRVEDWIADG